MNTQRAGGSLCSTPGTQAPFDRQIGKEFTDFIFCQFRRRTPTIALAMKSEKVANPSLVVGNGGGCQMTALPDSEFAIKQFHGLNICARNALVNNFKILDRRFLPT
jgi:hypothetical protein